MNADLFMIKSGVIRYIKEEQGCISSTGNNTLNNKEFRMNIFLKISLVVLVLVLVGSGGVLPSHAGDAQTLSGKVVQTMDSGGYTYVQIENNGEKTWVAVPKTKIVKGKEISFVPGMEMQNFESKTLKRTFDRIIFSGGVLGQQGK
jgi:hypothetical protein